MNSYPNQRQPRHASVSLALRERGSAVHLLGLRLPIDETAAAQAFEESPHESADTSLRTTDSTQRPQ